jgi:hypothetical protein
MRCKLYRDLVFIRSDKFHVFAMNPANMGIDAGHAFNRNDE